MINPLPAFPSLRITPEGVPLSVDGMPLRLYVATAALSGVLAAETETHYSSDPASLAISLADRLIKLERGSREASL